MTEAERIATERAYFEGEEGLRLFPNLGTDFEVLGPSTADYNCIAHSLGMTGDWINPVTNPEPEPLRSMDELYRAYGFVRSDSLDFTRQPGQHKVVLYAFRSAANLVVEVTHAAIQEEGGSWTSKLGQGPLIRHAAPQSLSGPAYGEPIAVYIQVLSGESHESH